MVKEVTIKLDSKKGIRVYEDGKFRGYFYSRALAKVLLNWLGVDALDI